MSPASVLAPSSTPLAATVTTTDLPPEALERYLR